jgi:hypothetical protein
MAAILFRTPAVANVITVQSLISTGRCESRAVAALGQFAALAAGVALVYYSS